MGCLDSGNSESKFGKGGDKDVSDGPVKRSLPTDIPCCCVYIAGWVLFVIVTIAGFGDGNPHKLYSPRDFGGRYCGVEKQWNNGPNLAGQPKQIYMMNTSATVDMIAKQMVCSSAAQNVLVKTLTAAKYDEYLCACCLFACPGCTGDFGMEDITDASQLGDTITKRMVQLTDPSKVADLFNPASSNGNMFTDIFKEFTKFFVAVCINECTDIAKEPTRDYTYTPSSDAPWAAAWDELKKDTAFESTIKNQFNFKALPKSVCPYNAKYCVPFPGTSFKETVPNYCTLELKSDVVNAVGGAASSVIEGMGVSDMASNVESSFGSMAGDMLKTIDTFIIVAILTFVIGLVFIILLRFFVGVIVWLSLLIIFLLFLFAGFLAWVRSFQCKGTGILESGRNAAAAIAITAQSAATQQDTSKETCSTSNCQDYNGIQDRTVSGRLCQEWSAQSPHVHRRPGHPLVNTTHPSEGWCPEKEKTTGANEAYCTLLDEGNYCRNPKGMGVSIWCFTTDPNVRWEACQPVGVLQPECSQGYEVENETMRDVLKILGYVGWVLAGIWFIMCCCLCRQIRLAIEINKAAAKFVAQTKTVLLVPMVQGIIGLVWVLVWCFCASFLLSQVPDSYTPTESFATYTEAYGAWETATSPKVIGKCTDKWPVGGVWKNEFSEACTGDTPKCWSCKPPRYIFDVRFAYSFFMFLWNNAFLIACGQCIIAGAVAVWFFTPRDEKGKRPAVRTGVKNAMLYHTGSLAFGSFILAVVQFIKYLLYYFQKQAEAQKNKVMALVLKILRYLIWCFEKCLKFLNKNAYIQIALLGKNFCISAKNAFFLILRNAARFGILGILGSIIQYLGFIFIMCASTLTGYFILKAMHEDVTPVVPILFYIFMSYIVANLYMNVFGLAVDSCLQCFIATEEMGGDSGFVPDGLKGMVDQKDGGNTSA